MWQCLYLAFGVICSSQPALSPQQAADILRSNAWKPGFTETVKSRIVFVLQPTASQVAARPSTFENDRSRAIRMGIPGSWTPLEWAILHSGGNHAPQVHRSAPRPTPPSAAR